MNAKTLVAAAACSLGFGGVASATDGYRVVSLGTLDGGTSSVAWGLNNKRQVVGQADNLDGIGVGFVWEGGVMAELPALAAGQPAWAYSINDLGVIVGEAKNAGGVSRPVKWTKDQNGDYQITDIGTLEVNNGGFGLAMRINNAGQITGYATVSIPGPYHAFRDDNGVKTDLGTLGHTGNFAYSQGLGINELGHCSGFAYRTFAGPEHGFYYGGRGQDDITPPGQFGLAQWHAINDADVMTGWVSYAETNGAFRATLYVPGNGFELLPLIADATDGYAYDLNESNRVVGEMFLPGPESTFYAFTYQNGTTTDLTDLTVAEIGRLSSARAVNDTGVIVGTAQGGMGPMAVMLRPNCAADLNDDGAVDLTDFFAFFNAFDTGDALADIDDAPGVDLNDFFGFLNAFDSSCAV